MPRQHRVVAVACAGLAAMVLCAALEFAGRQTPSVMPIQWQVEEFAITYPFTVVPDDELGFMMPPNQRQLIRTRDYTFLSETDTNGLPNHEPWPRAPALVFLGDSLITGVGVGLDGGFVGRLRRTIPQQPLVNLGLPGAGPERQYRLFRRFAANWRPSLVVACLFLASDFENDFEFQSWVRSGQGRDYNTYRLRLAREARNKGILQRVLDKSWLLDRAIRTAQHWAVTQDGVNRSIRLPDGTELLFERHALEFAATAAPMNDQRIGHLLDPLERLRHLVEENGSRLLLVLIPSKEELFGVPGSMAAVNLAARTKSQLASRQFSMLDLYAVLRERGRKRTAYYSLDIHLNEYGNRVVAEELALWLADDRRPSH